MTSPPTVSIIVPAMDRSAHLEQVLASLLEQDYPAYLVSLVDMGSADSPDAVLREFQCSRLSVIRCPRPEYFRLSHSRNVGARYSFSELVFFLDADSAFTDARHLSRIVSQFLHDPAVDHEWFANWRRYCAYEPVAAASIPALFSPFRKVYCHCHGSVTLLDRQVFQALGGFDEEIEGWGYEDTDLCARLELSGLGRIEMEKTRLVDHDDELRTVNLRLKDRTATWHGNRLHSDAAIRTRGTVAQGSALPGRVEWVELDGVRRRGDEAPQQDWRVRATSGA